MSSVSELLAQKAEIERKIAEAQRTQRADAIAKVRALMAENGLKPGGLVGKVLLGQAQRRQSGAEVP